MYSMYISKYLIEKMKIKYYLFLILSWLCTTSIVIVYTIHSSHFAVDKFMHN